MTNSIITSVSLSTNIVFRRMGRRIKMIPSTKAGRNCITRCFMSSCTSFMCIEVLCVSYITVCILDDAFLVSILKGEGPRPGKVAKRRCIPSKRSRGFDD